MFSSFTTSCRRNLKLLHKKITLNWLTATFFVFGFIHCFVQGILHSFLFTVDAEYSNLLTGITRAANISNKNHTYWDSDGHKLVMCDWIPHNNQTCSVIYEPGKDVLDMTLDPVDRGQMVANSLKSGLTIAPNMTGDPGGVILIDGAGKNVTLSTLCTRTLLLPSQYLQNYKREDLTWVFLQFYLLFMSLTAMIYDSVPHLIASLSARFIYTMWGTYAIYRTKESKQIFYDVIEAPGSPCSLQIFQDYDRTRLELEIPDLILSLSALLIAFYLTREVYKVYKSQFFRCMGAPESVAKIYKWFMAVQATLHLACFILLTAMSLWIDQLFNSYIHNISLHTKLYEAGVILSTVLMLPWIILGYYSIRNEHKPLTLLFLSLTMFYITGWGIMLYSDTYRWTFIAWPNLGGYIVFSFMLLFTTLGLSIVAMRNFGKGLKEYLRAERELRKVGFGENAFTHAGSNEEKVGISWDPPPLKKVTIPRPGDDLSAIEEGDRLGSLPALGRTWSHEKNKESIASFYA